MKIVMVAPYFYPKVGGLESYLYHTSLHLVKKHHCEVIVITSNHLSSTDEVLTIDGVKVYRLKPWFKLSNTPISLSWFISIFRIFQSEKPDVVNVHTPVPYMADVATLVAKVMRLPVIVTYHAGSLKKNNLVSDSITFIYSAIFEKIMLYLSDTIIVLNEYVAKVTFSSYKNKVSIIPPGITLIDKNFPTKKSVNSTLLFVGNLDKTHSWKGLPVLLQALGIILKSKNDVVLHIVGGGDNLDFYKSMANELQIDKNVVFFGSQKNEKLGSFYERSGILVLPSLTDAESLGLVILEAMAYGLPIVASKIGGIPYTMSSENGILVEPGDPVLLASAILQVISDGDYYEIISRRNIFRAKSYNWEIHTEELVKKYNLCSS